MPQCHLAQLNIARILAPMHDPIMQSFMAELDPVNATAEAADGFVWRLQTDDGNATSITVYDDEWLIVNMSVWTSVEALTSFIYGDTHRAVLRRRREWFAQLADATTVLWWWPVGEPPTVAEAERRLDHLRQYGPTAYAFSLRETFPPPADLPPSAAAESAAAAATEGSVG